MKTTKKSLSYRIGMLCIALSFISPLLSFFVPLLGLAPTTAATLVGLLLVGGPEVFMVLGAAFAGKEAVETIKAKIKSLFRRRGPPKPVGQTQYNIGLVLLVSSLLANWVLAYLSHTMLFAIKKPTMVTLALCFDLITIVSFFILGGQFWEKFKKLFIWEASVD